MSITQNLSTSLSGKHLLFSLLILFFSNLASADSLLVWLAEERSGVREIANSSHPLVGELRNQVESPISLLTPLLDLADQQMIDVNVLWQGDQEAIMNGSARYNPDIVVVGRVDVGGTEPLTEWLMWLSGERTSLSTQGDWALQVSELLAYVDQQIPESGSSATASSSQASPLAIVPSVALPGYQVTIYGLAQPQDYLQASSELRDMLGGSLIRPVSFNAGILRLNIQYDGAISGLQGEINRHLRFNERPEKQLEFSWN